MLRSVFSLLFFAVIAWHASAQGLLRDAEIEEILRDWTDPILAEAGLQPNDVQLFLINDRSLNAFVAGGQRIHLNSGLLIEADSAAQIKGVIAHETCHIACGHSVTRELAMRSATGPALVSIGLGVLAIAAGAPDAGAALIASSQNFGMRSMFTYTRAEETMADQMAVQYLAGLGQNPNGILDFFEKFAYQEAFTQEYRDPYFRSHPLARTRIQYAAARAAETGLQDVEEDPAVVAQYDMMRAKLIGYLEPISVVYRDYPATDTSQPAHYARAFAAYKIADMTTAKAEMEALLAVDPNNPYYHEMMGIILFESGQIAESVAPHQRSNELKPGNALLLINLARSLNARAQGDDLKTAEYALRDAIIVEPNNAFAWRQLAENMGRQGNTALAELATAESRYHIGDIVGANQFARRAVDDLEPNTIDWRRASDILAVTDPRNPDNAAAYRRSGRR